MRKFDVVIVGNGILGYSTAFALLNKEPLLKVGVIGSDNRPGSASVAAGAMLGCFGEVTKKTFSSRYHKAKFEMNFQAAKMWPLWIDLINSRNKEQQAEIQPGTFVFLNTKSGTLDSENFSTITKALETYNENFEEVAPLDIPGLNPKEDCRPLRAIYLPNEGSINSTHLLNALETALLSFKNFSLIKDTVYKLYTAQNKIERLELLSGEVIQAEHTVIASGAYSQELIDQIHEIKNRIPRILAGVGCALTVAKDNSSIKHVLRTPNRAGACGLHILPRDQDSLYVGATNNILFTPDTSLRISHINFVMQCFIEQIDQSMYGAKIINFHVGNRPVTIDTFPLIGRISLHGLWLLTGTYRDGIHLSPMLANAIAQEILGQPPLFNNLFLPERVPIATMTKEQAIAEAVEHHMAGGYEHSMRLPNIGWDHLFAKMLHKNIQDFYEQINTDFPLSADFFFVYDGDKTKFANLMKECLQPLNMEWKLFLKKELTV